MTTCIAVATDKGGVGKTTTCVNLSAALARIGRKVLLIDLAPQADATLSLGVDPRRLDSHIGDVLLGRIPLSSILKRNTSGIDIAPSHPELRQVDEAVEKMPRNHLQLGSMIHKDLGLWDYVIIDTQPTVLTLLKNALAISDFALVPVKPHYLSLEGMERFLAEHRKWKNEGITKSAILGILMTEVMERTKLAKEASDYLDADFDNLRFKTKIPNLIAFAEAPGHQQTIFEYAGNSKGAEAYSALAQEVDQRV